VAQARTVFAVPGDVGRATSAGCNLLIRDGAVPVLGPDDLIEGLSLVFGPPPKKTRRDTADDGEDLDPDAEAVLAVLEPAGSTLEYLAEASGLPIAAVLAAVTRLEVAGRAHRDGGVAHPIP
jgi:DNA processing protein